MSEIQLDQTPHLPNQAENKETVKFQEKDTVIFEVRWKIPKRKFIIWKININQKYDIVDDIQQELDKIEDNYKKN